MPKTLLLADDSVVIQKLVGLSFANEDVELVTTDNGDDALVRARDVRPDVVLADVVMPGKNGYEVCQAIKNDPELRHIPVLLLTGTFEAFDEDRARQVGSDGHITKPFEAQGLVDRVTDLLAQAPAVPAAPVAGPAAAAPAAAEDEAYDFFDDDVEQLGGAEAAAAAPPSAPPAALPSATDDDAFAFGGDADLDLLANTAPRTGEPETLDTNFELDPGPPDDLTVAVMPEASAAPSPPPLPVDLDTPRVAMDETIVAEDFGALPATPPPVEVLDAQLAEPPAMPIASPGETVLADDLFADPAPTKATPIAAPAPPAVPQAAPAVPQAAPAVPKAAPAVPKAAPAVPKAAPAVPQAAADPSGMPPAMDSGFEFGFDAAAPDRSEVGEDITAPAPPVPITAADFAVGADALAADADPLAGIRPDAPAQAFAAEPGSDAPALADAADSTHSGYDVSTSDLGDPLGTSGSTDPIVPAPEAMAATPRPDLSPMMRDQIHETLEKVAWEAFADVSDSIVRQVLQRVESIVWEVVPQMAEALIQEEIRRMKGDD